MNTIGELRRYALALTCRLCGRAADLRLAELDVEPETPLAAVVARLRCTRCKARGAHDFRLVWASAGTPFQRLGQTRR